MKLKAMALPLAVMGLIHSAAAEDKDSVPVVPTEFHTIYVPGGFDSNDRVQLVTEGVYPNTCYRPAPPQIVTDRAAREIRITSSAYQYEGNCLQVVVAFDQTLEIGMLEAGSYKVIQQKEGGSVEMGTLRVGVSRSQDADDFLYAPVSQAYAENKDGKTLVRVTGSFTDSCMRLSDVLITEEPRVLVVQPIATRDARPDCTAGNYPFDRTVEVAGNRKGRFLLHVRSLNGKAFNHLVDLN
jgi:hypothetical protein